MLSALTWLLLLLLCPRQRNKAVADLVYYKTDNDALTYGDEYSEGIERGNMTRGRPFPPSPSTPRSTRIEV